ncbi:MULTISPECIES: ComEA family DNA-binding protein [Kyrpidia]|uniref:ComEA family DNA-binding protein n=1 Tax=Kyrpidia TaxID=1129704 RepID=UPI001475E3B8|nr:MULTISPECIES: ComEA family DNA-binding protein [Kyrpidia]MCL6575869.1 ComEA family DNA-binding protein [Kyrpidia sp.]
MAWARSVGRAVRKGWWALLLVLVAGAWFLWSEGVQPGSDALPAVVETELLAGRGPGAPSSRTIAVDVKGAVQTPGVYQLPPGSRVKEALDAAGGALEAAELAGINLAAKLEDGAMVVVPVKPTAVTEAGHPSLPEANLHGEQAGGTNAQAALTSAESAPATSGSGGIVHINSGSVDDIDRLPGIGKSKAEAIVQYRLEHGPFSSVDRLEDVPGIGPKLVERIRSQVDLQ